MPESRRKIIFIDAEDRFFYRKKEITGVNVDLHAQTLRHRHGNVVHGRIVKGKVLQFI